MALLYAVEMSDAFRSKKLPNVNFYIILVLISVGVIAVFKKLFK